MCTINYRPALDHPVYKGGYYFIVFWALLDIIMSLRHYALYEGYTPPVFHLFVILAIGLLFLKRTITVDDLTNKTTYTSNIPREPSRVQFDNPCLIIDSDRQVGTIVIVTNTQQFDTKMTWNNGQIKNEINQRLIKIGCVGI